ncbi:hypothetical protein PRIC1_013668 [Phytophthora ramorum]
MVYMDGVVVVRRQIISCVGIQWGLSSTLIVGNCISGIRCPGKPFQFSIDELRLWSQVKSFESIRANFARSVSPYQQNILAYYRFDGNLVDATAHGNNMESSEKSKTIYVDGPLINMEIVLVPEKHQQAVLTLYILRPGTVCKC